MQGRQHDFLILEDLESDEVADMSLAPGTGKIAGYCIFCNCPCIPYEWLQVQEIFEESCE